MGVRRGRRGGERGVELRVDVVQRPDGVRPDVMDVVRLRARLGVGRPLRHRRLRGLGLLLARLGLRHLTCGQRLVQQGHQLERVVVAPRACVHTAERRVDEEGQRPQQPLLGRQHSAARVDERHAARQRAGVVGRGGETDEVLAQKRRAVGQQPEEGQELRARKLLEATLRRLVVVGHARRRATAVATAAVAAIYAATAVMCRASGSVDEHRRSLGEGGSDGSHRRGAHARGGARADSGRRRHESGRRLALAVECAGARDGAAPVGGACVHAVLQPRVRREALVLRQAEVDALELIDE